MHLHKGEGSTATISSEAKGTATFMESEKVLLCSSSKGEGTLICSSSDDGQVLCVELLKITGAPSNRTLYPEMLFRTCVSFA